MKKVVVVIFLILMGSVLFASVLWNGATSGMRVEDVKRLFPDATPGSSDYNISRGNLINGANLNNMDIGGKKYHVRFYFSNGKLDTVRLELISNSITAEKDVDDIRLQLTQKYGPVTDKTSDYSSTMSSSNYFWIKDGVKVELADSQAYGLHFTWIDYSVIGSTALL